MKSNFVIYGLPRSRTFWLSRFLAYGDWQCGHDELRHARSMADVTAWLSQPCTGTVETAAAPFWRLLPSDVRTIVVRRPVADVVDSLGRLGFATDPRIIRRMDAKLDQIEARVPGVLSVQFADLKTEEGCARIFGHCLPYVHDHGWWETMAALNLQVNFAHVLRHYAAFRPQMEAFARSTVAAYRYGMRSQKIGEVASDGISIQTETFDTFWRDARRVMVEHCEAIGQDGAKLDRMNLPLWNVLQNVGHTAIITARINGRVVGYITAVMAESFDDGSDLCMTQLAFFVSEDAKGARLAQRLQRAAVDHAKARGAKKMYMRAGINGDGPRFGVLYKRAGAREFGQLYELDLCA